MHHNTLTLDKACEMIHNFVLELNKQTFIIGSAMIFNAAVWSQ